MTLEEKSAAITGGEYLPGLLKRSSPAEGFGICAFGDIVDKACKGLMDRQAKYSIRRIEEMKERLSDLERELDAFLVPVNAQHKFQINNARRTAGVKSE